MGFRLQSSIEIGSLGEGGGSPVFGRGQVYMMMACKFHIVIFNFFAFVNSFPHAFSFLYSFVFFFSFISSPPDDS